MFSLILSALVGVLVAKIFDGKTKPQGKRPIVTIVVGIFLFLIGYLYYTLCQLNNPPDCIIVISELSSNFESNIPLQGFLIILVCIFIAYMDFRKDQRLSFKSYSKKIMDFTNKAKGREKSVLTIVAGDMDFLGNINFSDTNITNLMDNNPEYKQLLELCKNNTGIKIRILCSHGLSRDNNLLNSIVNGTISPDNLFNSYNNKKRLDNHTFQQLLRIGKIWTDFNNVEIRFYRSDSEDKQLRARFIDEYGIVYRKEGMRSKIKIRTKETFPFIDKQVTEEDLYSVHELNKEELEYYKDMVALKWGNFDENVGNKIIRFCQLLYHYVNNYEPRFHMALVYANSYEIARKGNQRKEFPPFGVMYLAACVRENPDWEVKLIAVDKNADVKEFESWSNYDVIGFSLISSYSYDVLKRCFAVCKRKKNAVIIAGGYQAEKFSHDVFEDFDADIIFKGEGEDSIRDFCQHFEDRNYAEIPGIIYRGFRKTIQATPGRGCVNIDKIPFPARDLLPLEDIVMTNRLAGTELKMVHMLFSRGCCYNCLYCAANQDGSIKKIRYRDKLKIVEELNLLINTYGIQGFSIIDDCFLTEEEKAVDICRYLAKQNLGLKWSLAARVDQINDNVLEALKSAGCIEIKFGIETGSDELLKKMNKGTTVKMAEEAIKKTNACDIGVKLFIITGLPYESDTTHEETKQFLERMYENKLVNRVSLLRYTPLAGSYIYNHPSDYGLKGSALVKDNFSKTHLYHKSFNWWSDTSRYRNCERWYKDMQNFIRQRWGDA